MHLTRRDLLAGTSLALAGCAGPLTQGDPGVQIEHSISGAGRIGFVGDVVLARDGEATAGSDPEQVWGALRDRLRSLDGVVGNLECCLTARGDPWPGKDRHRRADPARATAVLDAAGVSAVSLANDHAIDFGRVSLRDTTAALSGSGVAHAGAGPDREAALAPATFTAGGVTVAMIGVTDRFAPFAAGPESAGTAHMNLLVTAPGTRRAIDRTLTRISGDVDLVVASLHWGGGDDRRPEGQPRFARWLIEGGVDVVHAHGTRSVRGVEVYQGRPICYDTGGFIPVPGRESRGFLFELVVDDGLEDLLLHPVEFADGRLRAATPRARRRLHDRVRFRSTEFETGIVEAPDGRLRIPL